MPRFKIGWVGDKTYDTDSYTEYSISVKTEGGEEIRKGLKLRRPKGAPAPAKDEIISGEKVQHPKFDDAFVIQEDATGAVGETASAGGSAPVAASDAERIASIEAQAIAKGAGQNATSPEDFAARIKAGFKAIQECKGASPTQAPATEQTSTDDDIPF